MAISFLYTVLPPPAAPYESGESTEWPEIEKLLGTSLPTDYKEYINTYGTGQIAHFVSPYNPFSKTSFRNLLKQAPNQVDILRGIKEEFGEAVCPYPLFPEPSGLLPWGATGNGNILFWLMSGTPDEWCVVLSEGRGPGFEQYDESMTDFIAKLLTGRIISRFFRGFSPDEAVFVPAKPRPDHGAR